MSELEVLRKRIEELRAELGKVAENKAVQDQELLAASQVLDAVINEYYRLLTETTV